VSSENDVSTWLSHEADVGVKQMISRVAREPALHGRCLVGAEIVDDEMNLQLGRYGRVDRIEETAELDRPIPRVTPRDDLARRDVQRREERRRPVAHVVMRAALGLPGAEREERAVRSRACTWVFSSTQRTSARSGSWR